MGPRGPEGPPKHPPKTMKKTVCFSMVMGARSPPGPPRGHSSRPQVSHNAIGRIKIKDLQQNKTNNINNKIKLPEGVRASIHTPRSNTRSSQLSRGVVEKRRNFRATPQRCPEILMSRFDRVAAFCRFYLYLFIFIFIYFYFYFLFILK